MKSASQKKSYRLGTRGSDLALTQTRMVAAEFKNHNLEAEEFIISTRGDRDQRAFKEISGDGFFTKELEYSLLNETADFAVHSAKDLPSVIHNELPWLAFGARESTKDILVIASGIDVEDLENINDLRIGTSSPRRRAQLERIFPLAKIVELRGNVPTRAGRVLERELDAVVLAEAGLSRLNLLNPLAEKGVQFLELPFVTAPCQGILGLQTRKENLNILQQVANHDLSEIAHLEKTVLMFLGGGCHLEVGCEIHKIPKGKKPSTWSAQFYWRAPTPDGAHESGQEIEFEGTSSDPGTLLRDLFTHVGVSAAGDPVARKSKNQVWITSPLRSQLKPHIALAQAGFVPRAWPLIEPRPTWSMAGIENLKELWTRTGSLVLTSPFGADVFLKEFLLSLGGTSEFKKKKIFCVGQVTQAPFTHLGIPTEALPMKATASALVPLLQAEKDRGVLVAGTPESQLLKELSSEDIPFEFLEIYRSFGMTGPLATKPDNFKAGDALVFTSSSAVERFAAQATPKDMEMQKLYAIGPSTAARLRDLGFEVMQSPRSGSWTALIQTMKENSL